MSGFDAEPSLPSPPPSGGGARSRSLAPLIGILIVVVALGAGAIVWALLQSNEPRAAAPASPTPTGTASPSPTDSATLDACHEEVDPFLEELQELDSRLTVGLNYGDYTERVADVSVAFDRIAFDELHVDCATQVVAPAAVAADHYLKASNIWDRCIDHILSCDFDRDVKRDIQRLWAKATRGIDKADSGFDAV